MHVLHLLDASATWEQSTAWEQRVAIGQLLAKLPSSDYRQSVATIDHERKPHHHRTLGPTLSDMEIAVLPRRLGMPALLALPALAAPAAPAVRRFVEREAVDVIHAWGIDAATAARTAFPQNVPVAVSLFHPGASNRDIRILRTIGSSPGFAVCCAAQRVRQRLVEQGVPYNQTVLIRPGVDFAQVAELKRTVDRVSLGVPEKGFLVLAAPPPFDSGHDATIWSVVMHRYFDDNARVIIAGTGPHLKRLRRLAGATEHPQTVVFTEDRFAFEGLCAVADCLVIGSRGDISTTCLAWAMACATPIIASATYATAEILAHDLNAQLFKANENWCRRGADLCAMYDRPSNDDRSDNPPNPSNAPNANLAKIKEVARGQAYEVFSQRRFIEQHRQLYENLIAQTPPETNITDPALVGA